MTRSELFVQGITNVSAAGVTSLAKAFATNNTTNNFIGVLVVWGATSGTVLSVTDTLGNTYTAASAVVNGTSSSMQFWYCASCAAGANTVTATLSVSQTNVGLCLGEWFGLSGSGASPLDVQVSASSATGTALSSGSISTTFANDLLIGAATTVTQTIASVGASYTSRVATNTTVPMLLEDQLVTSTGSYSATATGSLTDPWVMQLIAIKTQPNITLPPYVVTSPQPYTMVIGDGTSFSAQCTIVGKTIPPIT